MIPEYMKESVAAWQAEMQWPDLDERFSYAGTVRTIPIPAVPVEAPPDIEILGVRRIRAIGRIPTAPGEPRKPNEAGDAPPAKDWGNGVCRNCGATFAKTGSSHQDCTVKCRRESRNAYMRAYIKTLTPEQRAKARGKRKKKAATS